MNKPTLQNFNCLKYTNLFYGPKYYKQSLSTWRNMHSNCGVQWFIYDNHVVTQHIWLFYILPIFHLPLLLLSVTSGSLFFSFILVNLGFIYSFSLSFVIRFILLKNYLIFLVALPFNHEEMSVFSSVCCLNIHLI